MELSPRMMEIIKFIKNDSLVADIGTDHGYIPTYLIENNLSKKVIATDISEPSLNKTIDSIRGRDFEERIETRLGSGLEVLKAGEVDTIIIAGMGGLLIGEILEKNREIVTSCDNFIFQPMIAAAELRKYLINKGFQIIDESLAREGDKFYEIIYCRKGAKKLEDNIELGIGNRLIEKKHPLLVEFITWKLKSLNGIIGELENRSSLKGEEKYRELLGKKLKYEELLLKIEGQ